MRSVRYLTLALLTLAPVLAAAQVTTTNLALEIGGNYYAAEGALFGEPFLAGMNIGPLPFVPVEGGGGTPDATPEMGCDPLVSGAEIAGNIAFISRGACAFVIKVQNAAAAGAVAAAVYNHDPTNPTGPDGLVSMSGDCTPEMGCSIPAAFVSYNSSLAILDAIDFGDEGTLIPEKVEIWPPPAGPLDTGTVRTTIFADGFIGHDPSFSFGEGFVFNGEDGLFVSSVLIGIDGEVTSNPYDGTSEFTEVENTLRVLESSEVPAPFDTGAQAIFTSPLVQ